MDIIHKFKKKEVKGQGSSDLFISSNQGGYLCLGHPNRSSYQGWFHFLEKEWELYKTIESIELESKPYKITYKGNSFERLTKNEVTESEKTKERNAKETFILNNDKTLTYAIKNYEGILRLNLDFREIHDFDEKGRIYKYYQEKGCTIIEYQKYNDDSLNELKEKKFLVIKGHFEVEPIDAWIPKRYEYDNSRNVKSDFYVYNGFNLKVNAKETDTFIVFRFDEDKETAITECMRAYYSNVEGNKLVENKEEDIIETNVRIAYQNLVVHFEETNTFGIFAGLPWFYQVWSRDELISSIGLIKQKNYWIMKEIILKNWNMILDNGLLGNRWPSSELGSADGIGWLYKRTKDFIELLERKEWLDEYLDQEELIAIYVKLIRSLEKIEQEKMNDFLIKNDDLETWMDTHGETNDKRSGHRIEIQALHLSGLALAKKLSVMLGLKNKEFEEKEKQMLEKIREKLVVDNILRDGIEFDGNVDFKVRPNVFLAYYIYPKLVSNEVWKKTFDLVIQECWLNWGGLSSISKNDPLFCETHTGINNKSYHRGDSWYFVNNITAICLNRLDKKIYGQFVEKIKKASVHEMMFLGFIGQCAELSDAKEQSSKGCLAQAWSAATLLELLEETKNKEN